MAVNPTKVQTVIQQIGAAIKLPIQLGSTAFIPNAITINNRTGSTIQVGPGNSGPFILCGSFTLSTLPWTYGGSIYVQEVGTPPLHLANEFLQIDFLAVDPRSGGVGAGQITSYAPGGWGAQGPANVLGNINAGDPFNYGQVQQLINLLTGVMTGQAVTVSNRVNINGNAGTARLLQFETALSRRFAIGIDGIAESGGNAGSNFLIGTFDDLGNVLKGLVLKIFRDSGGVYVGDTAIDPGANNLQVQNNLLVGGTVDVAGGVVQLDGPTHSYKWQTQNGLIELDDVTASARRITVYDSGGVFVGTGPSDPGANNLTVQGNVTVVGGVVQWDGPTHAYKWQTQNGLIEFDDVTVGARRITVFDSGGVYIGTTPVDPSVNVLRAEGGLQAPIITSTDHFLISNAVAQYAGAGAPGAGLGANGDLYVNQTGGAGTTIYQKRAGAWVGIV